jgi:hypothetical protein
MRKHAMRFGGIIKPKLHNLENLEKIKMTEHD